MINGFPHCVCMCIPWEGTARGNRVIKLHLIGLNLTSSWIQLNIGVRLMPCP